MAHRFLHGKDGDFFSVQLSLEWHFKFLMTGCLMLVDHNLLTLLLQVRDVRLIMDRNSRRSKGVGYVPRHMNLTSIYMLVEYVDHILSERSRLTVFLNSLAMR